MGCEIHHVWTCDRCSVRQPTERYQLTPGAVLMNPTCPDGWVEIRMYGARFSLQALCPECVAERMVGVP